MEEMWVPASAVFHPYVSRLDLALFRTSTNGLASGNNLEEAVLHGLLEVVERDAWSLAEGRRKIQGDVVVPESGPVRELVDMFTSKGVEEFMGSHNAIDPMELILTPASAFHLLKQPVGWVKGVELNSMRTASSRCS